MGNFFRGWRRKTGLVMLVMACMFMIGWVRSSKIHDVVIFDFFGDNIPFIESMGFSIGVGSEFHADSKHTLSLSHWSNIPSEVQDPLEEDVISWRYRCAGFGIGGTYELPNYAIIEGIAPYWFFVVPQTVIAAWLLVSRPRKPIPNF